MSVPRVWLEMEGYVESFEEDREKLLDCVF